MQSEDKTAIVTGAGTGVGRAATLALLGAGFKVALVGRRLEKLDETVAEADAPARSRTLCVSCDVTSAEAVAELFKKTVDQFGRLDLLFNNAGASTPSISIEDLTVEQWQTVVDVNLTASFLCLREAFRVMRAQQPKGGRIINNGSISAHAPRPGSAPYTATKHAITGLTKAAALDGRKHDIAVSQIDIGNAATPMTARMAEGVPQPDGTVKPEPRMDSAHVGSAIAYMAGLPLDANVQFMTIMATKMPFIGRG